MPSDRLKTMVEQLQPETSVQVFPDHLVLGAYVCPAHKVYNFPRQLVGMHSLYTVTTQVRLQIPKGVRLHVEVVDDLVARGVGLLGFNHLDQLRVVLYNICCPLLEIHNGLPIARVSFTQALPFEALLLTAPGALPALAPEATR